MYGSVKINLLGNNKMKLTVWTLLIALVLAALLLSPRVSGFLYDSGGDYNVVWPRAYNNWVNMDGYIDVPTGGKC
jgi:hypothetical protein